MENLIEELQAQLKGLQAELPNDIEEHVEGWTTNGNKAKDIFWAGEEFDWVSGKVAILEEVIKKLKEFSNG